MKVKTFALDDTSLMWLQELSERQERSRSQIVRRALREAARGAGLAETEQPQMDDAKQQEVKGGG